ncbi:ArsR/SmtB family transcription factor [Thalassospira lucentensis]|uniref:ArsR/SmtB family transcription factor n=1 Tax=Thalassospira lucentensis TaxID=168935 RepID=UPI00142E5F94|nr:metalloregulator ArsR/SmtB family transcription factor [Thalassospira lucentensis]NIZ03907.1 helix-turn-helix transcriptional regulator [Thalassospira lucentensis]
METSNAISALGALAQEHRLAAFRLLVRAGKDGIAAGELARQTTVAHNTMSSHLAILSQAGLITATRQGRSIIYRMVPDVMRDLLGFLADDCCQGRPELCGLTHSTTTNNDKTDANCC